MVQPHTPPHHVEPILNWYKSAQIDYTEHYIKLYISYNAWYRQVTNTINDRQALSTLKKRVVIWDDYSKGKTMAPLRLYMERLSELTQREPIGRSLYWEGYLNDADDWRSLIEFWYQVRCLLVHGEYIKPKYVWLAYETLDTFMGEIIDRMQKLLADFTSRQQTFTSGRDTSELNGVGSVPRVSSVQEKMYRKYFTSPDLWQVDMKRV